MGYKQCDALSAFLEVFIACYKASSIVKVQDLFLSVAAPTT